MVTIIPTVFAKNKQTYDKRLEKLLPLSKELQIDFMDGTLQTPKGLIPTTINDLPKNKLFEAHLMVAHPEKYVDVAAKKGFGRYLFHIESQHDIHETRTIIDDIKKHKMRPGLVVNPTTPIARIKPFIKDLDVAMVMGHEIGVEGVGVSRGVYSKLRALHKQFPQLKLEVDGGVDTVTAPKLAAAGATRLSVGSAISSSSDPKKALLQLQKNVREMRR